MKSVLKLLAQTLSLRQTFNTVSSCTPLFIFSPYRSGSVFDGAGASRFQSWPLDPWQLDRTPGPALPTLLLSPVLHFRLAFSLMSCYYFFIVFSSFFLFLLSFSTSWMLLPVLGSFSESFSFPFVCSANTFLWRVDGFVMFQHIQKVRSREWVWPWLVF